MDDKIEIFGIEMDCLSAKAGMIKVLQYMENDSIDTIEIMSMNMLMNGQDNGPWKEHAGAVELVIPGESEILEAVGITDKTLLREAKERVFLKMFMRYLQKNHRRVFLLAETEKELTAVEEAVRRYNRGIRIAGHALMSPEDGRTESVINDINGTETDCILSVLTSPFQEEFIYENKALLNAKLWFGCGNALGLSYDERPFLKRARRFMEKKLFRYRVEREKDLPDEK